MFIKHTDLGFTMQQQVNTYEICKELFKTVNKEAIRTVQRVRGLWRIYINNEDDRMKLITQGFSWRTKSVTVYDRNPFRNTALLNNPAIKTVKITISNQPESITNKEIESMLKPMGCKLETVVQEDYIRDDERKFTSIKNDNRSVLVKKNI